jgi:DNA-binding CsgD family transcriptional regulator/PAS domain-containing protein
VLDPSVIDDLYDGALDNAVWNRAMLKVADGVGASCASLLAFDPSRQVLLRDEGYRVPEGALETYRTWVDAGLEPRTPLLLPKPAMVPFTTQQLMPIRQWEGTQIFNEFLTKIDCAHLLGAWLHKSTTTMTCITFQASVATGPFDADDALKIQPVLSHIARALNIRDRLERHAIRAETMAACMERSAVGILVLDQKGRVVETNARAQALLGGGTSLSVGREGALCLRGAAGADLRHWLVFGRPADSNPSGVIHVQRPLKRPLSILVNALPHAQTSWAGAPAKWIIFVFDPEVALEPSIEILAADLGLSEREAQISALLAGGLDIPHIALRLGISVNTTRVHLKSIFGKVGVHSQVELVRCVLQGPAGGMIQPRSN